MTHEGTRTQGHTARTLEPSPCSCALPIRLHVKTRSKSLSTVLPCQVGSAARAQGRGRPGPMLPPTGPCTEMPLQATPSLCGCRRAAGAHTAGQGIASDVQRATTLNATGYGKTAARICEYQYV